MGFSLCARSDDEYLSEQAINTKSLVSQTPSLLGDGLTSNDETISFACEERNQHGERTVFSSMAGQRGQDLRELVTCSQGFCLSNFY